MVHSSSWTSKKFPSGRRSSLGGARPRPLRLPLLVVVLLGFLSSSSENTAGFVLLAQAEEKAHEEEANEPGGCYDMTIHKCNCNPESCSAELCAAAQMLWTAECPELCAPEKCPAASFVMVTGGATVTEDFIPVVLDGEGGACYDPIIHKCNCHADTCSAESCAAASMIWSADCPDHCNPEDCPAATFSSSASTTTLEEEETTSAVEAPTTTSGSSNDEADPTTTSSTDPDDEARSGSSRMRAAAAATTTVATIGAAVAAALL